MTRTKRNVPRRKLLTIGQAAELLGVHPDTLRNWDRAGKFRPSRHPINGYRLYSVQSLERLQRQLNRSETANEISHGQ